MKTNPFYSEDGRLYAFEITSAWIFFWPLFKVLRSVRGVTEVKRQWFDEDRVSFLYMGHKAVVNEAFGDNSRYWIGFLDPEISQQVDLSPIHEAFKAYTGATIFYSNKRAGNST
ncbi:MAG: hypothetical protein AAFY29_11825 [Pseudomonadota bacterium]